MESQEFGPWVQNSGFIPFLEQFQQASLFYFHTGIQSTSTTFTLLHPSSLPTRPRGVSPWYVTYVYTYFKQISRLYYLLFLCHLLPYYSTATVHFVILSSYTDALCFRIIHCLPLFLSSLSVVPSDRPSCFPFNWLNQTTALALQF
jgi:hypothetical protein